MAREHTFSRVQFIELALIVVITTIAFTPVMFNFFLGDDFVHLSWLSKCVHDTSLLWRNFNHSWLDVVTTKFYRPLISVFMFTDYLVWKNNGFGFHLTNVLFHLANCCLIYAITTQLRTSTSADDSDTKAACFCWLRPSWPAISALLFGLYPLHPEAVSWITGRVDTIVTTFYLAALYFFMLWRDRNRAPYLVLSLSSTVLAMLSKEMAITIPAMLVAWEAYRSSYKADGKIRLSVLVPSVRSTLWFWVLLVVYFGIRYLSLGTFVGGYDNSLIFVANWHAFASGWLHSIKMTLIPINRNIIGDHNLLTIGWCIGLAAASLGTGKSLLKESSRRMAVLLAVFIAISIVPVYKIFAIADDLESSRLVYLTSSFLCMLIGFGLTNLNKGLAPRPIQIAVTASCWLLLGCSFGLLERNNSAWRKAGLECTAIRSNLESICKTLPVDAHILLVNLPDQINGAYICRNAAPGIIEPPQFSSQLKDCIFLNSFDPVFPFGYLKRSLQDEATNVHVFYWNHELQTFKTVVIPQRAIDASAASRDTPAPYNFSVANVPCWETDFIQVKAPQNGASTRSSLSQTEPLKLRFENEICNQKDCDNQVAAETSTLKQFPGKIVALRPYSLWACGNQGKLLLAQRGKNTNRPEDTQSIGESTGDSTDFESLPALSVMPELSFQNSGYLGTKGFCHLAGSQGTEKLICSKNEVSGAHHFSLEILRPNVFLSPAEQNGPNPSGQKFKEIQGSGLTGELMIKASDLAGPGLYQARLWSVNERNEHVGLAGDHIIISVDP